MPFIPLEVFANNPSTTVVSGGTSAPSAGTVETWTVASSASFPTVILGAHQLHVCDKNPASSSEIITVTNITGTTWTVTRGAEATVPVTHSSGFTVVQIISAGTLQTLQYPPWQFPVQAYGAQGDGKIGTGGTGSAGSATFTDAGASFINAPAPAGDVGKLIIVNQGAGGSATNPFCGTITAVNSSTSVTLSGNLTAATASAPYIYGTDDTSDINAAVTAATNWAINTGNYKAQVVFEPQNYMLGGLTQSTTALQYNTQIPVPVGTQFGRKLVIDFIGVGDASEPDYFASTVPSLQGTCLVSTLFATGQPNATYSYQSVIGGPTATTGMTPGGFANTLVNIDGITVVCPWNAQQYGFDFRFLAQANFQNGSYLAFAPVNFSAQTVGGPYLALTNIVSNAQSTGLAMPAYNNNDNCNIGLYSCEGAVFGLAMSEHVAAQRVAMIYCDTGIFVIPGATAVHGSSILYASVEDCNVAVGTYSGGGQFNLFIGQLDVEGVAICVIDNGQLTGTVYYNNPYGGIGTVQTATWKVIDTNILPGPWSGAPAVPASGTASTNTQRNTAYRDATLYLSATTITAVFTGPAATGLTQLTGLTQASGGPGVSVRVPTGHYWSATYTGSLTAKWILD